MDDKVKRNAIFKFFGRMQPHLVCLQETHLQSDSVHLLRSHKYPIQFHSTHSSYSRGVRILISATVTFECIQQQVDREGKYVFLLCKLNGFMCIFAAIYIPPPSSVAHLRSLTQFMALFPDALVMALGDFNNTLDSHLDRSRCPGC